jgi:cytochrome b6-f complex iron-sulfur subunit
MSGEKEQEMKESHDRRNFLSWFSALAVALMGGAASAIGGGFLYPIKRQKPPPLFVCLEAEVPYEKPVEIKDPRGRKVLLMRLPSGDFLAVSTICSHLGCAVFYRPDKRTFECPCHGGVFDGEGHPIYGPPQKPLDRYPAVVREGKVFVQFS